MPSIRYYNQTAPLFDFIASMEEQGASHPLFGGNTNTEDARPSHPWESAWAGGFPFGGPFAHRPRHPHHHRGRHHDNPQEPTHESSDPEKENEKSPENPASDPEEGPSHGRHRGPDGRPDPRGHGPGAWRGRCGARGGRGGPFGGRHHPYHHPRGGPQSFGGPFGAWAEALFGNNDENTSKDKGDETFTPDVDVYDTPEAFIIHASLAGAKKEDVNVSWDAEKSELGISGVLMRDGDEEMLKTLALDERKVGMFERKVRLGSRASPAQVDVDGIAARMEDGVLRVEVPKLDAGYVEVKKVDVE